MLRALWIVSVFCVVCLGAQAATYNCTVEQKFSGDGAYSQKNLDMYRPRVIVYESDGLARLSRCSISPSAGGIETCDEYAVDRIIVDGHGGISKYYYFKGQLDVQIWSNGNFVENNGRGTVSFGRCSYSSHD